MVTLTDPDGILREIQIVGRADRFDVNSNDSAIAAVMDYKNQGMTKIKKRAERLLDDPQLLIYARAVNEGAVSAHLPGRTIKQAEWVSLKADLKKADDKIVRALDVQDMPGMMAQFSEQLSEDLEVLWARKPMKAFAPDSVCQYCEVRGICRKGMW
jgi:ATP-dependent helicase/nuclease subunit B